MCPLCYIHRITLAFIILLDIVRTNGICGSQDNTTVAADFRWTSIPTPIISCNGENAKFEWGSYQIGKYEVGARSWYKNIGTNALRIAQWNQAQGFVPDDGFKGRVERIGEDGLLLKSVTPKDNNIYTLIVRFELSSDPSPEQNITLTVYEPPLEGCCRPTIHRLQNGTGLYADLHIQACGTQPFNLEWNNVPGTTASENILKFESAEIDGTFKVCVNGTAVQKCYKGRPESLCQEEYIEKRSAAEEQNMMVVIVITATVTGTVLLVVGILLLVLYKWKLQKSIHKEQGNNREDETRLLPTTEIEQRLDKATEKIAGILYVTYKTCKELALSEISKLQLENIDLRSHNTDNCIKHNPTYEQCLYYEGKPRKLLIVEGDLGSGKMSWCRKFVKTWCKCYERRQRMGNDTNEKEQTEMQDIDTLESFPLLFFVSLRNVETYQSPTDIIQRQCLKKSDIQNNQLEEDLQLLIKHSHDRMIFLIHGADEARGDIDNLKDFLNIDSLKIVTCHARTFVESRYNISEEQFQLMASICLKKIDKKNVEKYAKRLFTDHNYPQKAYQKFMELVECNKLKQWMQEAFFVQPLINIWFQSDTLPSDIAGVCLSLIQDNLKKRRKNLTSYIDLKLGFDKVVTFIPRAQGMIFIINHGKALKGLGKTAYHCLKKEDSGDIFFEEDLMTYTKRKDKRLPEISIAAKLVSTAPVGDSGDKKRLRFCHPVIRSFMVAFYLACHPKSDGKNDSCKDDEFIQQLLSDLRKNKINT